MSAEFNMNHEKKPDWVPATTWEAALHAYRAWGAGNDVENLKRLMKDHTLRATWRTVNKRIINCQIPQWSQWLRLLDLLANWPENINFDMRKAAPEAARQLDEIGTDAVALAEKISGYCALTEKHSISKPGELWSLDNLLQAARGKMESLDWAYEQVGYIKRPSYFRPRESEITVLLHCVSYAAFSHQTESNDALDHSALEGNQSRYAALVRYLDDALAALVDGEMLPIDFAIGDTHTAALLSALLGEDVSRENVAKARSRRKKP